jgi:hypothetical protein
MPRRKQPVMMTLRIPLTASQHADLQQHLADFSTEGPTEFARRVILEAVDEILEASKSKS